MSKLEYVQRDKIATGLARAGLSREAVATAQEFDAVATHIEVTAANAKDVCVRFCSSMWAIQNAHVHPPGNVANFSNTLRIECEVPSPGWYTIRCKVSGYERPHPTLCVRILEFIPTTQASSAPQRDAATTQKQVEAALVLA